MKRLDESRLALVHERPSLKQKRFDASVSRQEQSCNLTKGKVRDITLACPDEENIHASGQFALDRALSRFTEAISDAAASFSARISRLLELGCKELNLSVGVLTRIDGTECEIIAVTHSRALENCPITLKPGARYPLAQSLCVNALYETKPFAHNGENRGRNSSDALGRLSYLGGAVRIGNELYGTLSFSSNRPRQRQFNKEERLFVSMLCKYAANEIGRRRVQEALTYRVEFEKLITAISAKFINLAPSQVNDGIREALGRIGEFAGVDMSYVFLFNENKTSMDISHWWLARNEELKFRLREIPVDKYAYAMKPIVNGEVVYLSDISALPLEAAAEKRFAARLGITSAIIVPMIHSGRCIGLVGFASRRTRRPFDQDIIKLLSMVGSILASAVEYKRAQDEVNNLEAQVRHAQKLESLGLLAGGIAHDFNNLLMGIVGNAGLALRDIPINSPSRVGILRIEKIAQHAAELTNQLLAYAGKGAFFVEVLSLSEIVENMVELLSTAICKKHKLTCNFAHFLPPIDGDAAQLSQVVMNLITNASEAIGEGSGSINLSTGLAAVDRDYLTIAHLGVNLAEGVYVFLQVTDTGSGMDDATIAKIFDPFFTTKFTGRGLGLAAVHGIVRSHGGAIRVHSTPGQGSTFTVLFPCSEREQPKKDSPKTCSAKDPLGRLILVVDDEENVRTVIAELLKRAGFTVLTAADGQKALSLFRRYAREISASVLDMTMPDMGGEELYREFSRIVEHPRVILSSGYSEQEVIRELGDQRFASFIQKPYAPETLIDRLHDLIGQ